jgi:hypothetical protein
MQQIYLLPTRISRDRKFLETTNPYLSRILTDKKKGEIWILVASFAMWWFSPYIVKIYHYFHYCSSFDFCRFAKETSNCKTLGGERGGEGVKQDLIF